jgi:hypothetical protein
MDLIGAEPLRPGDRFTVRVFADRLPARIGETVTDLSVAVSGAAETVNLEVWIAGTAHFTFLGERVKPFVISLKDMESVQSATFDVQVRPDVSTDGDARLVANFSYQGPCQRTGHARPHHRRGRAPQGERRCRCEQPPTRGTRRERKGNDASIDVSNDSRRRHR